MSSTLEVSLPVSASLLPTISFRSAVVLAIVLAVTSIIPLFFRKNITNKDGVPIPPGPPRRYAFLPKYPERILHKWAQQYGGLYTVFMGNQLTAVISDPVIARDLLTNHGAIFSSRRMYFLKNQTILRGRAITGSPYNDTWRHHRKLAATLLTPAMVESYSHNLDYEAHILVRSLWAAGEMGKVPVDPTHASGRYSFNNMFRLSFGTRTESAADPLSERALALANEFMELTGPWSNAVDFIKPLEYLPTQKRARARKLHDDIIDTYGALILRVQARMDAGEDVPDCMVKTVIETREAERLDWEDMCMLSAVFTLGGVHSMTGIIQWFLALLPSYPEIQARVHEEMDRVVGREHYPTAADEKDMPYMRAVIKEVARLHSPFWMATPHFSTEDFVYKGMFLPKDTLVVLNIYSLHHSDERYPDSFTFNPDRYLGDDLSSFESANLPDATQRDHWAFSAGRRICPGFHVAEREMWLAMSRLMWAFEVKPVPGVPISLDEYEGANGRTPMPYKVQLVPRHDRVREMLEEKDEVSVFKI
ncbi:cytochrome P450 [Auriscalpium vulgare]|uniref:Cytochrome P450 n=1 Tax=Auriscalpium vulgare TaxID=40419 RepID=A0ACB8S2E6_9AGAM|nr:cytochrome P450 [Auriscalpium vulgare]